MSPRPGDPGPLARLLAGAFRGPYAPPAGAPLVVAVSGGRDSTVLLHLLRFAPGVPDHPCLVAHLDHAMRPGSRADAEWVRGVCRAWDLPFRVRRLAEPPTDEAGARRERYAFLEEVRVGEGAASVLTAHHADDQAETVLFRAARGTGPRGLRGILPWRDPGVWRPLLEARRSDLAEYAAGARLSWRTDPTNRLPRARNVLRHRVLPLLEDSVAPGATRALAGLARRARDEEAAWAEVEDRLLEPLDLRAAGEEGLSFLREALLAWSPPVRGRLLRAVARRVGVRLTDAGTRRSVTFVASGESGRAVELPGSVRLRRELDRMVLLRGSGASGDRPLRISSLEPGSGRALVGGRSWRLSWGTAASRGEEAVFSPGALRFPLEVRGWRPGDRIHLPYGRKKLTKLFLEARISDRRRRARPVVVDADQEVLWVPGVARSTRAREAGREPLFRIGCMDGDDRD